MEKEKVKRIGIEHGLVGRQLLDFVKFVQKAFPKENYESYVSQWAVRFKKGTEYEMADMGNRKKLIAINKKYYTNFLNAYKRELDRFEKERGFRDVSWEFSSVEIPRMSRNR